MDKKGKKIEDKSDPQNSLADHSPPDTTHLESPTPSAIENPTPLAVSVRDEAVEGEVSIGDSETTHREGGSEAIHSEAGSEVDGIEGDGSDCDDSVTSRPL